MELKQEYKQSERGAIPKDWKTAKIDELSYNITVGFVGSMSYLFVTEGVPVLRGINILPHSLCLANLKYISRETHSSWRKSSLQPNDIVIVRVGYPGTACVIPEGLGDLNAASLVIVRPNPNLIDSNFLCYVLNSTWGIAQIQCSLVGGAQQVFNTGTAADFIIPLPRLEEQRAIAAALSDVDALIAALDRLIAKKRDIKQAAMQELLTGRRRLPGFGGEWSERQIGDFTNCTAGGTPSTFIDSYWGGKIRWMNSGELHQRFVTEVEGRITKEGLENSSTKMIPPKCVLIGLAGQGKTRGTVAINLLELCINQSIAAIYPSPRHVSEYLYYNLESRYEELRSLSSGEGGRGGLNLTIINSISVPMPEYSEQEAIAAVLRDMDAEIDTLDAQSDKVKLLKQGMMQELLTGRIRLVQGAKA